MKERGRRLLWIAAGLLIGLAVLAASLLALWPRLIPRLTEDDIQSIVVSTIMREAPQSFLVTGELSMMTIATGEDVKYLLPDLARIPLGTARATVRVPGQASYGFNVSKLQPSDIDVGDDGVIDVTLPEIHVYSVAPDLEKMEIRTEVGWQRRLLDTGREVDRPALRLAMTKAQQALRREAVRYLSTSTQPRVHTAEAIEKMLRPALVAAGVENPEFRFRIGPRIIMEPGG